MNRPKHTLVAFMEELYRGMQADYERIRARAPEDPGTAGDEGEESWAELLRSWLPATYPVVTKGRIINAEGHASPQVDVLVLHPAYPRHLRNRKLYLADGVVAAFECKLTLKGHYIRKAVQTAVTIKHLYRRGTGTPYRELRRPCIYGLLAHSSGYAGDASARTGKVQERLDAEIRGLIKHPSDMLDVLCVADSGTLFLVHQLLIGSQIPTEEPRAFAGFDAEGGILSFYFATSAGSEEGWASVLGELLSNLMGRMAWEDASLRRLSKYFQHAISTGGTAIPTSWPSAVLSEQVVERLVKQGYEEDRWSEWYRMM